MGQPSTIETPTSAVKAGREGSRVRSGALAWLACAAFYYPFFWLSTSLVRSAPALARATLLGEHLRGFSLTAFGASAASAPPLQSPTSIHGWSGRAPFSIAINILIVIAAAVLVPWLGKRARVLAGLALAVLADVALANGARRLFELHRLSPATIISSLGFFSAILFALHGEHPRNVFLQPAHLLQALGLSHLELKPQLEQLFAELALLMLQFDIG